jgi:hypothetical protein
MLRKLNACDGPRARARALLPAIPVRTVTLDGGDDGVTESII